MATLNTEANIAAPDDFYERLIATHRGLTDAQSALVNAKLILLLANHIGDPGRARAGDGRGARRRGCRARRGSVMQDGMGGRDAMRR